MLEDGSEPTTTREPFRILTVCTGNICRSPMAERLLQAGLDERFPGQFIVESAGTGALVGNPIDPQVAAFIRDAGADPDNFSARQLTPEILARQNLVLALSREHRSKIVELDPLMLRRTFTLREFARLLLTIRLDETVVGADRWTIAIPKALRARTAQSGDVKDDDVVDPYKRNENTYERMRADLASAVSAVFDRFSH